MFILNNVMSLVTFPTGTNFYVSVIVQVLFGHQLVPAAIEYSCSP